MVMSADHAKFPLPVSLQAQIAGAEKSNESDDDQINRDNIVQQPGHDQNENTGDKRYQGGKAQVEIHGSILSL